MSRIAVASVFMGCALAIAGCAPGYYAHRSRWGRSVADSASQVTAQQVVAMTRSGVGDDVIISLIRNSGSTYHLKPQDVIELADSGVSNKVIGEMIKTSDMPEHTSRGYYYSPPDYWYYGYPYYWYPWYSSLYFGYWGGFYRPHYFFRSYYPHYTYTQGYRGSYGRGGFAPRNSGRRR